MKPGPHSVLPSYDCRQQAPAARRGLIWACSIAAISVWPLAAQDSSREQLRQAIAALRAGQPEVAERIAGALLGPGSNPDLDALRIRASAREQLGNFAGATQDLQSASKLLPQDAVVRVALGGAAFKSGSMELSLDAFDEAVELNPRLGPRLWQRGIAHYYARRYADGARQFETHRTVNPQDVENSVWHFLCVAATEGVETARARMMPVRQDTRVPMAEILDLFGGSATPQQVLRAAERASVPSRASTPLFYAHLYLGLYYEALGESKASSEHMAEAVAQELPGNYMWHVARIHRQFRNPDGPGPID